MQFWEWTYFGEMNKITHEYVVSECIQHTNTVSNLLQEDTWKHLTEFYTLFQTLRMDR